MKGVRQLMKNAGIFLSQIEEYWDRRPCNIRHSNLSHNTLNYFREIDRRRYFIESHILAFAEFEKWKNKRVLEIGCGIGIDGIRFVLAGAEYSGIELSSKSLEIAQQRFKIYGCNGQFYKGNAEEMLSFLPIGQYDLVYSFGVLHHTPNPEQIVDNIRNYMTVNSEFRLMLYSKYSWKSLMILLGLNQSEAQSGCPLAKRYSYKEIKKLLRGFQIIDMHKDHIFPYKVNKYIRYEYKMKPWLKYMPIFLFKIFRQWLGCHTLIRCKLEILS